MTRPVRCQGDLDAGAEGPGRVVVVGGQPRGGVVGGDALDLVDKPASPSLAGSGVEGAGAGFAADLVAENLGSAVAPSKRVRADDPSAAVVAELDGVALAERGSQRGPRRHRGRPIPGRQESPRGQTSHDRDPKSQSAPLTFRPLAPDPASYTAHDARGLYVERVWCSVLGPTSTLLLRISVSLPAQSRILKVQAVDPAQLLGMFGGASKWGVLGRSLRRSNSSAPPSPPGPTPWTCAPTSLAHRPPARPARTTCPRLPPPSHQPPACWLIGRGAPAWGRPGLLRGGPSHPVASPHPAGPP